MVSITFVVGILFLGMMGKSMNLQNQLSSYDSQISDLDRQIEEEEGRTTEIDDLKEYMETDGYVEETAREKLGLVKENEIVFKEGEEAQQGRILRTQRAPRTVIRLRMKVQKDKKGILS